MSNAQPGWYPNPENPGQIRWWDGAQWTDHEPPVVPAGVPADQPGSSPASAVPPSPKRRGKKVFLISGIVVGVIVLLSIMGAIGSSSRSGSTSAKPSAEASAPAEVVEANEGAPVATDGLAARVTEELKTAWNVSEFTEGLTGENPQMLNWYIASIQDVSPGVVEVIVQVTGDETDKEAVKQLSINVLNLTGLQIPELEWVMVQTADGKITEQSQRSDSLILRDK